MKLNKTIFIMCIAILGILTTAQLSHAYTMMVNLGQQTDGTNVRNEVDKIVKDEAAKTVKNAGEEGSKLASNEGLLTGDSTLSPLVFSEKFATGNIQQFAEAVAAMQPDQIAVIIAISMNSDDIKKAIQEKVNLGKVAIVQARTTASQEAFNALFGEYKEGFSFKALDKTNPTVIQALQGAV
jgi:hypothetical protein